MPVITPHHCLESVADNEQDDPKMYHTHRNFYLIRVYIRSIVNTHCSKCNQM